MSKKASLSYFNLDLNQIKPNPIPTGLVNPKLNRFSGTPFSSAHVGILFIQHSDFQGNNNSSKTFPYLFALSYLSNPNRQLQSKMLMKKRWRFRLARETKKDERISFFKCPRSYCTKDWKFTSNKLIMSMMETAMDIKFQQVHELINPH